MKNHKLIILNFIIMCVVIFGCGPKKITDEQANSCYPQNLRIESHNEKLTVIWDMKCDHLYTGFNIYISEKPIREKYNGNIPETFEPFNTSPFKGDTNPSDGVEHFEAEGLENGKIYYVTATVLYTNLTNSILSNEAKAVCGPHGEISLSVRYSDEHDGFSFDKNQIVRADNVDNDIYYFHKNGENYLNSPNRLDGFLKENKFSLLPFKGDLVDVKQKVNINKSYQLTSDRIKVKKGDWVQLVTSDNKYALIKVLGFTGTDKDRRIKLFYAYSTVANELIF
ncbi:MAG: hypothetical protein DRP35_10235 [Candidatus Zixiibacteriota bacterium]|nr:MAG: hypothetical protein DRP35_10235 [candidate division Zixibacteria bacterium]